MGEEAKKLFVSERFGGRKPQKGAALRLDRSGRPRLALVYFGPRVVIGRSTGNDIVIKPLDGGEPDRDVQGKISRQHLKIMFAGDKAALQDSSSGGTWLDGEKLSGVTNVPEQCEIKLANRFELSLSKMVVPVKLEPLRGLFGEEWKLNAGLCWRLERHDLEDAPAIEEYLLGFGAGLAGTADYCTLRLPPLAGLAELHALFFAHQGQLWLLGLDEVRVNEEPLRPGEVVPLVPHLRLGLGELTIVTDFPRQLLA